MRTFFKKWFFKLNQLSVITNNVFIVANPFNHNLIRKYILRQPFWIVSMLDYAFVRNDKKTRFNSVFFHYLLISILE